MGVRRAGPGDEEQLRALRVRALTDAPERFGSTIADERDRTGDDLRRWFAPGATFFFESARGPIGLVAVVRPDGDRELAQLISMWVAAEARGLGVADALVRAALAFAAEDGATVARLHVYDTNERAIRLYERNGFVATGARRPPDGTGRVEIELVQPDGWAAIDPSGRVRWPEVRRPMAAEDVLAVLEVLVAAGVDAWVDGGWAVDALLGAQTRDHADLDLAVPLAQRRRYVEAMGAAGYLIERYDGAANTVMADRDGRHVDVHLVDLEHTTTRDDGVVVHGPEGIAYEVGAFRAMGTIGGRAIACCTPEFLVRAHTGYEIDADDVHDVVALCDRFGIDVPHQHARFLAGD